MAIVFGTNAGFVLVAPTIDPSAGGTGTDNTSRAFKDTTPADIGKITEIGWYCDDTPGGNVNFEVGLYDHDTDNNLPLNRLYLSDTNAVGTQLGWKVVSGLNWSVSPETIYWLGLQLDNTIPNTDISRITTGGLVSVMSNESSLADPWVSDGTQAHILAFYAVVEEAGTFSELSGTIAATSVVENANLSLSVAAELSGTIAAQSTIGPSSLGSVSVGITVKTSFIKRLVVAGNNQIWIEDI